MIGYTRVSTGRQADEGLSLAAQVDLLRGYAVKNGFELPEIYQDIASASGKRSYLRRGDLRAAAYRANELGVPLLVPRLDRLSRDVSTLRLLDDLGLEIYSVADGGRVTKKRLRHAIQQAQEEVERLSRQARQDRRVVAGRRRKKNSGPSRDARRSGTVANILRSDQKVKELADFLAQNPAVSDLGPRRLARHLNQAGLWNLVSEREGVREAWTADSLKKPLAEARKMIAAEAEMDREEMLLVPGYEAGASAGEADQGGGSPDRADKINASPQGAADGRDEEDPYANNPLFGIF